MQSNPIGLNFEFPNVFDFELVEFEKVEKALAQ
jgi:hypothetical protein